MTPASEPVRFRRIVVTLDGSPSGPPALDVAVRLAALLNAELEGVFVEDINLVRLAELPFLREVRAHSLVQQAISAESLQRDLRVLARQAEENLQRAAAAVGVRCSFRVWRGHTGLAALSNSFEADILSLGGVGVRAAYRAVSLLPRRAPVAPAIQTVNVLFSDSTPGHRALAAACHLAVNLDARINVLLPAGAADAAALERQAEAIIVAHHATGRTAFVRFDADGTRTPAARAGGGVLVVGGDNPVLSRTALVRWLETFAGPLLVVR